MKPSKKTCYCCDATATTKEHIPPKCFFEKPRPTNLITVPSCVIHNSEKSKDDEYFRWFIVTTSSGNSKKAENLLKGKILPSFKRKPALLYEIWKGAIKSIDIHSKGGIYLYSKPGFKYNRKRIQKIISQLCKGLFSHHFGRKVPENYTFGDYIIYPEINEDTKKQICSLKLYDIGDGSIFSYRYIVDTEDSNIVIWFLMFFSSFLFISMIDKVE